jgi:hypothetical protein
MDDVGIAGFTDIIGLVAVVVSMLVAGFYLQRLKGPGDREPSR